MEQRDVCIFGHISRELNGDGGNEPARHPGGVAFNTAATLAGLGARVTLVTKIAGSDEQSMFELLHRLQVNSIILPSPATSVFECKRGDTDAAQHRYVHAVAAPFFEKDLDQTDANWILLGPQSAMEMSIDFINKATDLGAVTLDIQGLVNVIEGGDIVLRARPGLLPSLSGVTILKANQAEAYSLTGVNDPEKAAQTIHALGPREVIVTTENQGAVVSVDGEVHRIPAFAPKNKVDTSGWGDTFLAGYLYQRIKGDGPVSAGQFASVLAALKAEQHGPFTGSAEQVDKARNRLYQ